MKHKFFTLLLLLVSFGLGGNLHARNLLQYRDVIDVQDYKGTTFLSLMKDKIKPALDKKAIQGFRVADSKQVEAALNLIDKKVSGSALRAAGGKEKLLALADKLHSKYDSINFYDLPNAIAKEGFSRGRYDLNTFFALVSEGGVGVEFDENNIAYNVNYGTGKMKDDERTGRSFGESVQRGALDASDKHYLTILENYVREDKNNVGEFYRTILSILLNNDATNMSNITANGQAVAADFLAVYIAEQDRHLMTNFRNHPWDEALLEVTLLAAFHSGQSKVKVMFGGKLTDTTYQQAPGCEQSLNRREKPASMTDYWQFSSSTDPKNCSRSGINITRREFRALGKKITKHQRKVNPDLVYKLEKLLGVRGESENIFADLSGFIIDLRAPERLSSSQLEIIDAFTKFLLAVQEDAEANSQKILQGLL